MKKSKVLLTVISLMLVIVTMCSFSVETYAMGKENATTKSKTQKTVTYADVDVYDCLYLSYNQMIEWAKNKNVPYEELVSDDAYIIHIQMGDKYNQGTTTNNKSSVADAAVTGAARSFGIYLGEWLFSEDDDNIDWNEALDKALTGAIKSGAKQYVSNSTATTQQKAYVNIFYYYNNKKSAPILAEMYRIRNNNDKFINEIVNNYQQLSSNTSFYARLANNSVFGKVMYFLPTFDKQKDQYCIYLIPYTTYNSFNSYK